MDRLDALSESLNESLTTYKDEVDYVIEQAGENLTKEEIHQVCKQVFYAVSTIQSEIINYLKTERS